MRETFAGEYKLPVDATGEAHSSLTPAHSGINEAQRSPERSPRLQSISEETSYKYQT